MSCVWMLQRGNSGDGCVLASILCKYVLRKGDLFVFRVVLVLVVLELGKGATSKTGKSLFRAANVWWRCAQYFVNASCGKMP